TTRTRSSSSRRASSTRGARCWARAARCTSRAARCTHSGPGPRACGSSTSARASTPHTARAPSHAHPNRLGVMTTTATETYRGVPYTPPDSHVPEPIELYAERVDAEYRERAPRIEERDGWRTFYAEGLDPRKLMTADQLVTAVVGGYDIES